MGKHALQMVKSLYLIIQKNYAIRDESLCSSHDDILCGDVNGCANCPFSEDGMERVEKALNELSGSQDE